MLLIATQSQAQSSKAVPPTETNDRVIKLYPNPATTYITFDFQKSYGNGLTIQVYSFLGKKMLDVTNTSQKTTINLTDFNRGLYMYHLLDATGKIIATGKFQVTK
jgi:hypothetical protein